MNINNQNANNYLQMKRFVRLVEEKMNSKKRIMFVCHGNICRSPMAEFIFKKMIADRGLEEMFEVQSSATSSEEIHNGIGNFCYPPALRELKRHGIPYENRRAVQLKYEDYEKYDIFVGMDSVNVRNMHKIFGLDKDEKIFKLLDFTSHGGDIADPWYTYKFDVTYADIYYGCDTLLKALLKK